MKNLFIIASIALLMIGCGDENKTTVDADSAINVDTCPDTNKFCHEHDGLNWTDKTADFMTWNNAKTYCANLGGRLPTISELRMLIRDCPSTETGGACGVTDSCLSSADCSNNTCNGCSTYGIHSVFGDIGPFWSSSVQADHPDTVWIVYFSDGYVHGSKLDSNSDVRCVK